MTLNLCHPDSILPGLQGMVMANTFLDKELNKKRTVRVQKYISMYHLDIGNPSFADNEEEIPCIQRPRVFIPEHTWPFYQARRKAGVNDAADFWCEDYDIMRFVHHPERFIPDLQQRPCVFSFDLSTFQEFRLPLIRWNIYLNRLFTQEMQAHGINVIPAVQWRDRKSFPICFLGIPHGCPIAISTVGVKSNRISIQLWKEGVAEALRQIQPDFVFIYGERIDYDFGSTEIHYLDNEAVRRVRHYGR